MRRRSLAGPLLLILVGGALLGSNLGWWPGPSSLFADYWPWLLVLWGGFRLAEGAVSAVLDLREPRPAGGGAVVAALALALAGTAAREVRAHAPEFLDDLSFVTRRHRVQLDASTTDAAGVKTIEIRGLRGSIRATGVDNHELRLSGECVIRGGDRDSAAVKASDWAPRVERDGETLRIISLREEGLRYDLRLQVPAAVAVRAEGPGLDRVEVSGAAEVSVESSADRVVLADIGGRVRVEGNLLERVRIESAAGPVELLSRRIRVAAACSPERIDVERGRLRAVGAVDPQIEMKGEGRLDLIRPGGTARAFLERGIMRIEPGPDPAEIEARAMRADVHAVLDLSAPFSLEILAVRGKIRNQLIPNAETPPGGEWKFDSPAGPGPRVRLESEGGDVTIAPAAAPPNPADDRPSRL